MSQAEEQKKEPESVPLNNINNSADESLLKKEGEETAPGAEKSNVDEKMNTENADVESGEKAGASKRLSIEAIRSAAVTAFEEFMENPRNRKILYAAAIILIALLSVLTYLLCTSGDNTYRFVRIVPKPRGKSNLIQFVHGGDGYDGIGNSQWQTKVDQIEDFLKPYRRPTGTTVCPLMAGGRKAANISDSAICGFDLNSIARECLSGDYGYKTGSPCIFIVFNNIPDWTPYNGPNKTNITSDGLSDRFVNLECNPEHSFDLEHAGPLEFTPYQGYSVMFFPYKGQRQYLSPFVVLKLAAPTHNVGISIQCKLIARNLYHESDARFRTEEPVPFIPFTVYIE